jgi:hypothetical protein
MAFQCEDNEPATMDDALLETGIYAAWQLNSQTINGVTLMTPPPEMILEFYPDENREDSRGDFDLEESSSVTYGVFIMDQEKGVITFKRDGKDDLVWDYSISQAKDYITFTYQEGESLMEEGWHKIY